MQYILNEEGRARPVADINTGHETRFVYDYFIKDHLGNVRSTVTANPISLDYMARHEIAMANVEQLIFDNIPNVREGKPGSINPNDGMAARLVAEDPEKRVGTAILLRTMPGDKFTINAQSFYEGAYTQDETIGANDLISSLSSALMGGNTYAGVPIAELPENIQAVSQIFSNPSLLTQLDKVETKNFDEAAPKAHLNYLFFDDHMNLVAELSGKIQVQGNGSATGSWQVVGNGGTTGTQICNCTLAGPGTGGFVLVFVDNQSIGKDVWFDDIHVEHYTSEVLSEDHYYPFGLTVQTLPIGAPLHKQPYKLTGKELERSFDLNMYDFGARQFDMTRGQWTSVDPLAEKYVSISPYNYCGNNPVKYMDVDGKDYVLAVNHDTRTITVKATYYTATGNTDAYNSATTATQFWNNQSGNYQYAVGKGDDAVNYAVDFDLTVTQVDNPTAQLNLDRNPFAQASDKMISDNSSNSYSILPDDNSKFKNNSEGQNTNAVTTQGSVVDIKESRKDAEGTGAHEVGHTLGLEHYRQGIMTSSSNDPSRSNSPINSNIQDIIKRPLKDKNTDAGKGYLHQTGTAPKDFSKGKIKENKK